MNVKKLIWIPRLIAAIIMLQTLFFKFTAAEESVYIFSTLHMEPWGRIGTGIGELIASILILVPAVSWMGAGLAVGLMGGAIFFHLTQLGIEIKGDGGLLFFYACLVLLCAVILLLHDRNKIIEMVKNRRWMFLPGLMLLANSNSQAQGCSDAGICSVGASSSLKVSGEEKDSSAREWLGALSSTLSFASGEQQILAGQLILEPHLFLTKHIEWQVRVPFLINEGNLARTSGIGDVASALVFRLHQDKQTEFWVSAGVRLPVGNTDLKKDQRSLPMPYQTGLGTTDILPALSLRMNRWSIAAAGQFIVKQSNANSFSTSLWSENKDAQEYFNSRKLRRGNDLSLRSDYRFGSEKKWIAPGVLMIYRLGGDTYINNDGNRVKIDNSEGLTLNIVATGLLRKSERSSWSAQLGFPVIVRETRADGLTRSVVLNFTHIYKFGKR